MTTKHTSIPLGFEVGGGRPVEIPLKHMVITGQSQEAGKTTSLEALIRRAECRAVAFVTKRGEGAFDGGNPIPPYFRERADWVFVSSLIDATLGERNKLLRPFLMQVCRNTRTLADVQRNVKETLRTSRGFKESIYTEIDGYLDLVVPQLGQLPPADRVELAPGLNVCDLSPYSTELQGLVIRSILEHVHEHETGVVSVIPEAWEFIPQGRGTPVKAAVRDLIRKGAVLRNYVWFDSQDLAGVEKEFVRACPVFLIGVQREANEIKRTLANIPAGVSKPKAGDVATLGLGQFYACFGHTIARTYVRPAWMTEGDARAVATGDIAANELPRMPSPSPRVTKSPPKAAQPTLRKGSEGTMDAEVKQMMTQMMQLLQRQSPGPHSAAAHPPAPASPTAAPPFDLDSFYEAIKLRLMQESPALLMVLAERPELVVEVERREIKVDGDSYVGRIAKLIAGGFLGSTKRYSEIVKELQRTGPQINNKSFANALKQLVADGFLTREGDEGYKAVPGMKARIVEKK